MRIRFDILTVAGFALLVAGVLSFVAVVVLGALESEYLWIALVGGCVGLAAGSLALLIRVLIDRLRSDEDRHYSDNVHH